MNKITTCWHRAKIRFILYAPSPHCTYIHCTKSETVQSTDPYSMKNIHNYYILSQSQNLFLTCAPRPDSSSSLYHLKSLQIDAVQNNGCPIPTFSTYRIKKVCDYMVARHYKSITYNYNQFQCIVFMHITKKHDMKIVSVHWHALGLTFAYIRIFQHYLPFQL